MTWAAPVPVPPPIPAAIKTMFAPCKVFTISFKDSSAAAWPISSFAPAPKPLVKFNPIWILDFALLNFKSWASVLTAINSTPCRLFSIISLIAFPPAPPTPSTNSRGCSSLISGALKLIVILVPLVVV